MNTDLIRDVQLTPQNGERPGEKIVVLDSQNQEAIQPLEQEEEKKVEEPMDKPTIDIEKVKLEVKVKSSTDATKPVENETVPEDNKDHLEAISSPLGHNEQASDKFS